MFLAGWHCWPEVGQLWRVSDIFSLCQSFLGSSDTCIALTSLVTLLSWYTYLTLEATLLVCPIADTVIFYFFYIIGKAILPLKSDFDDVPILLGNWPVSLCKSCCLCHVNSCLRWWICHTGKVSLLSWSCRWCVSVLILKLNFYSVSCIRQHCFVSH